MILGIFNHQSVEENNPIMIAEPRSPAVEAYRTGYEMMIIPTIYAVSVERFEVTLLHGDAQPIV